MLREPLSMTEAVSMVSHWLERPNVQVIETGERHWRVLGSLLVETQVRGADVMDAHLAALALEHGATIGTHDRDFARFPGLKTLDPLPDVRRDRRKSGGSSQASHCRSWSAVALPPERIVATSRPRNLSR